MLNKIMLMGRLTRDPELRTTQSGRVVTSFSLAVERDYKGQDGTRGVDFFDVSAWGKMAEFVSRYFAKGRMCMVVGRAQLRDWTDTDGAKRRSFEIMAESVYFCGDKGDRGSAAPTAPAMPMPPAPPEPEDYPILDVMDPSLPF